MTDAWIGKASLVLTTPERRDLFCAVLGADADVRLNPLQTYPLEELLKRAALAGAQCAVLDEAHFHDIRDMVTGIEHFVDDEGQSGNLRIVVVCPSRAPGDVFLARIVGYCAIYDVLYNCDGVVLVNELASLLRHPNKRLDVAEVLRTNVDTSMHVGFEDSP